MTLLASEGFGFSQTAADYTTDLLWFYSSTGITTPTAKITSNGPLTDNYLSLSNGVKSFMKTVPTPGPTIILGTRARITLSTGPWYFLFCDASAVNQMGIGIDSTGVITAYRGMTTSGSGYGGGTSIGASSAGAFPSASWNYIEIKIFISATVGTVDVLVNGVSVLALTGQNTKGSGSSSDIGQIGYKPLNGSSVTFDICHIYVSDNVGAAPQNTFLGDVRVQTVRPVSNGTVDFTATPGNSTFMSGDVSGGTNSANVIRYVRVVAPASGTLASLVLQTGSAGTGNWNLALYSDVSSQPSALLGTATAAASWSSGTNTLTVAGGPAVVSGAFYWIALISDALIGIRNSDSGLTAFTQNQTYGSGFPNPAASLSGSGVIRVAMNVTQTANWENESTNVPNTTTAYNYSTTVGDQDLFNMGPMDPTLTTVFGVAVKTAVLKTDAGAKSAAVAVKSGATTNLGPSTALNLALRVLEEMHQTNPDTGIAWTPAEVNSMQVGYEVTA